MTNTVAALTLALASTFAVGAADAHDHGRHYHEHRGPDFRFHVPQPRYFAPPPVQYYAPPPVRYYVPRPRPVETCDPVYDVNNYEVGSTRQRFDANTGQALSRPHLSYQLCP